MATPEKVWIVMAGERYESDRMCGIFSSEEKARAKAQECMKSSYSSTSEWSETKHNKWKREREWVCVYSQEVE